MSDFYKVQNNIFSTGEITQSKVDLELSNRLCKRYDMRVVCSGYYVGESYDGKTQGKLCVLIDGSESRNDITKAIGEFKGAGNYGLYLNSPQFSECFRKIADDILKEFSAIPDSGYMECDEVVVTVFDFVAEGINRIYWTSSPEVRKYMNEKYHVGVCDIVGVEDSEYIILIDTLNDFNRIINDKSEICKGIFEIMKGLDYFDLLRYNELKVSFLLKEALSYEKLNRLLMRRSLC